MVFHSCWDEVRPSTSFVFGLSAGSTASKNSRVVSIGKPVDGPGLLSSVVNSPALPEPMARAISKRRTIWPELVHAASVKG